METVMRNFFQFLAKSKTINGGAKRYGFKLGAHRFVAGETLDKAVLAVRKLNEEGKLATLDHLGEFVANEKEASLTTKACIHTLKAIAESGIQSNLSVKLTSLGLDLGKEICLNNMRSILDVAQRLDIFVRIDMEDFSHCQITQDIFYELRQQYEKLGLVIQAYLYRSTDDIEALNTINANLRLVKGAYKESSEVAFPNKVDVDNQFLAIIKQHLLNGNYTAIASHDVSIIDEIKQFIKKHNISAEQYEFQMLYGISEELQKTLVKEGYRVRIYVPYGHDWFGYYMRRLAERPANVWFVLKNMFK